MLRVVTPNFPATLASLGCLAGLFLLMGCQQASNIVAVVPRTTGTPLWEPLHLGAVEAARGSGLRIYWNAPADETDTGKQLDLVGAYRAKRYRGVIFAPTDTMASRSVVLEATQDHVPMVVIDDRPGPQPGPFLSYVTNDESVGARLAAERVAQILDGRGSIAVIGISGTLANNSARSDAFESTISRIAPQIRVVFRHLGTPIVTEEQQIAQGILDGPLHIDAIVALSASATRGAFYAKVATNGRSKMPIVGFDQDLLAPIKTGDIDSIVVQNTREIGKRAMHNLQAEIRGEEVNGFTTIPPILVTRQNLDSDEVNHLWEYSHYRWSEQ